DPFGNTVPNYTGTVHLMSSDSAATLPPDYTFTTTDAGAHTFTATVQTRGYQTITSTDVANNAITGSASVLVAFVVANTNDSGPGSLRQAITDANNHPGTDDIVFDIPGTGSFTIQPL